MYPKWAKNQDKVANTDSNTGKDKPNTDISLVLPEMSLNLNFQKIGEKNPQVLQNITNSISNLQSFPIIPRMIFSHSTITINYNFSK